MYLQYVAALDLIFVHRSLNLRIGDLSNSWGASIHHQLHLSQKDPQKVQKILVRRWHPSKHRSPLDILQSEDPESIQKYPMHYIKSIGSKEIWKLWLGLIPTDETVDSWLPGEHNLEKLQLKSQLDAENTPIHWGSAD